LKFCIERSRPEKKGNVYSSQSCVLKEQDGGGELGREKNPGQRGEGQGISVKKTKVGGRRVASSEEEFRPRLINKQGRRRGGNETR